MTNRKHFWRVPILMYHRIVTPQDSDGAQYATPLPRFEWQMNWLKERGFQSVSLFDVARWLETGFSLPRRSFVITLDDGFTDAYEVAVPVMQRHQFEATIFLTTSFVGSRSVWDEGTSEPVAPLMTWDQAAELANKGITFGSHTCHHWDLTTLDPPKLQQELSASRDLVQERFGSSDILLAYPFNRVNRSVIKAAADAGYAAACAGGFAGYHRYCLDRLDPSHSVGLQWALQISGWCFAFGGNPLTRLLLTAKRRLRQA